MEDEEIEATGTEPAKIALLSDLIESPSLRLLVASGADLIRQIGTDLTRNIILDILVGRKQQQWKTVT
jgi:hypothetical protein